MSGSGLSSQKGLILPGTFFLKSLEPRLSALDFQCIIHTGCEAIGVIGYELVPDLIRTKADSPIQLIGAGSNSLKGGTHCMHGAPYHTKGKSSEPDVLMQPCTSLILGQEALWGIPYWLDMIWQFSEGKGHSFLERISVERPSLSRPPSPHLGWN